VLKDPQGKKDCYYKSLDKDLTCNQTEYAALVTGLDIAKGKGASHLEIKGDSKLVCKQVDGDWKVRIHNLKPYHIAVEKLRAQFVSTSIGHIRRCENSEADWMLKAKAPEQ
jgi:ribonuclease HI